MKINCADCSVSTFAIDEWYMVKDEVWEAAWTGQSRHDPDSEILCIGCLETRLGRTLAAGDFVDVPVNDLSSGHSDRLRDRLQRYDIAGLIG
jgi:hypothetical protein